MLRAMRASTGPPGRVRTPRLASPRVREWARVKLVTMSRQLAQRGIEVDQQKHKAHMVDPKDKMLDPKG
jgi:hypothetical protein